MSTEEKNGPKRFETILNSIRKEAQKIRESNDKLRDLKNQLVVTDHVPSAQILDEAASTIHVALEHLRSVFKVEF